MGCMQSHWVAQEKRERDPEYSRNSSASEEKCSSDRQAPASQEAKHVEALRRLLQLWALQEALNSNCGFRRIGSRVSKAARHFSRPPAALVAQVVIKSEQT